MKVGINGFGKVGQALLQRLDSTQQIDVVAINEIGLSAGQAAALLGSAAFVSDSGDLVYGHRKIKWLAAQDHRQIGWDKYGTEVVVEASQLFQRKEMVEQSAGGRIVILMTGDLRGEPPDLTLVLGVNDSEYRPGMTVLCVGSDRTQGLAPVLRVVHDQFGIRSYRACIHRPPYVGTCARVQNRPTNAEQLARVLPALTGCGEVTRVDDPEATFVTVWLDISTSVAADEQQVQAAMQELAAGLPKTVQCSGPLPAPVGDTRSALIDSASIKAEAVSGEQGDDHRVWLKLYYDPVVSYAERIREQLLFLAIHRRPVSTGPSP
jgi:glyceraldehyde 3-phosphate dehydrogenase